MQILLDRDDQIITNPKYKVSRDKIPPFITKALAEHAWRAYECQFKKSCGRTMRAMFKKDFDPFVTLSEHLPHSLDRWGTTVLPDGQQAFVTEPYIRLAKGDKFSLIDSLNSLCDRYGWWWWISSCCYHNPGHTLRIGIAERPCPYVC